MKHRIDPKIDCVFKALLGSVENRNLLVHFLNAILTSDLTTPIIEVEILNPYNDKEFLDDKLSVVDVKAKDSDGRLYQIEIQLLTYRHLPERMVYTWCDEVARNKPRNPPCPPLQRGVGGISIGRFRQAGRPNAGNGRCTTLFRPTSEDEYAHEYTL